MPDVDALGLVVNFDVPQLPEDYIHRVGRTARNEAAIQHCCFLRLLGERRAAILPGAGKERTEGHLPQEDVFEALERETVPVTA